MTTIAEARNAYAAWPFADDDGFVSINVNGGELSIEHNIDHSHHTFTLLMDCTISDWSRPMIMSDDGSSPTRLPERSKYYQPLIDTYRAVLPRTFENAQKRLFVGEINGGIHPNSINGISRMLFTWRRLCSKSTRRRMRRGLINAMGPKRRTAPTDRF